jgi:hypothetical protein
MITKMNELIRGIAMKSAGFRRAAEKIAENKVIRCSNYRNFVTNIVFGNMIMKGSEMARKGR